MKNWCYCSHWGVLDVKKKKDIFGFLAKYDDSNWTKRQVFTRLGHLYPTFFKRFWQTFEFKKNVWNLVCLFTPLRIVNEKKKIFFRKNIFLKKNKCLNLTNNCPLPLWKKIPYFHDQGIIQQPKNVFWEKIQHTISLFPQERRKKNLKVTLVLLLALKIKKQTISLVNPLRKKNLLIGKRSVNGELDLTPLFFCQTSDEGVPWVISWCLVLSQGRRPLMRIFPFVYIKLRWEFICLPP